MNKLKQSAKIVTLKNENGLCLKLTNFGATWLSCCVPMKNKEMREVLLGSTHFEDYLNQLSFLGATIGRYANRIANASYEYQGKTVQLAANEGNNQLHGGKEGFDKRFWEIVEQSEKHAIFTLFSADGDQGFRGNLHAKISIYLDENYAIDCLYEATCDQVCPVFLTNHSYFNLDGESKNGDKSTSDARNHALQINAAQYLPVNNEGIPEGDLKPVANSSFDFRTAKKIARDFLKDADQQITKGFDHAFLLDKSCKTLEKPAAILQSADDLLTLQIFTNAPAIQLYSANYLGEGNAKNRAGNLYQAHQGIALEPECLPNSPNQKEWQETCFLQPEQTFQMRVRYAFKND